MVYGGYDIDSVSSPVRPQYPDRQDGGPGCHLHNHTGNTRPVTIVGTFDLLGIVVTIYKIPPPARAIQTPLKDGVSQVNPGVNDSHHDRLTIPTGDGMALWQL